MEQFDSVDDILKFAINGEQEAYEFYTNLANQMDNPMVREVFEGFAKEEQGHKAKLQKIKEDNIKPALEYVEDIKLADYLIDVKPSPDMDYQEALILAMKKEKAAFKLYTILASRTNDINLRQVFLAMAQEEAKHKLRFEIEYDDVVLKEN
ncbi:MAG: ferritin family protein [Planctomycetota bacterium]|jgi:rubrerythrin